MKKILILLVGLTVGCQNLYAQSDKAFVFGFGIAPMVSWMGTDNSKISASGANLGFNVNVQGEMYFGSGKSDLIAGLTGGLGLSLGNGGSLAYDYPRTVLLQNTNSSNIPDTIAKPTLKYSIQYLQIPIGFKMRTKYNDALGMRFFAHLPVFTLAIPTASRVKYTEGFEMDKAEKANKDVGLLNLFWGLGGGVEYYLQDNTALSAGLYFNRSTIDATVNKKNKVEENGSFVDDKSNALMNNIALRIGINF